MVYEYSSMTQPPAPPVSARQPLRRIRVVGGSGNVYHEVGMVYMTFTTRVCKFADGSMSQEERQRQHPRQRKTPDLRQKIEPE